MNRGSYLKWTKDDIEKLSDLWQKGISIHRIADEFLASETTIYAAVKRYKIPDGKRFIPHVAGRHNTWTTEMERRLIEMKNEEYTVHAIAVELGISHPAVWSRTKKLRDEGRL